MPLSHQPTRPRAAAASGQLVMPALKLSSSSRSAAGRQTHNNECRFGNYRGGSAAVCEGPHEGGGLVGPRAA